MRAGNTKTKTYGIQDTAARWSVDRWGRLIAGMAVLACTLLAFLHDPVWLYGLFFAGMNLIVSALTNCCPVHRLLILMGAREREDLFLPGGHPRRVSTLPQERPAHSALVSTGELHDEVPARVVRRSNRIERARLN